MRSAHRVAHRVRTLLIMGLLVGPFIATPRLAVAASSGAWEQQAPRGATATPLTLIAVQCPSTTVCYAVGSSGVGNPGSSREHPVFQRTTDGGATWTSQRLNSSPYDNSNPTAPLSCPGVARCYLLTNTGGPPNPQSPPMIWVTEDSGQTWIKHTVGRTQGLQQIVCPSTMVCYVSTFHPGQATHEDLLITRNGGATWIRHTLTVTDQPLLALACPGINDCYLSGLQVGPHRLPGLAQTHDGGRTWKIHAATATHSSQYENLACPTVNRCYAVGTAGLATTDDGGRTWTKRRRPGGGVVLAIACPTATICAVTGDQLWRTTDGGSSWKQALSGSGTYLLAITCPAPATCYAVGYEGMILKTTDGVSWQEPTPYTRNALGAIACPSSTTCYAIGEAGTVLTTTDGGATWVRRSSGTSADLLSIACPGLRVCLALGFPYTVTVGRSFLLETTNGGQTWQQVRQHFNADNITCLSLTVCFAADGSFLRTNDGGRTWTSQILPKANEFNSIACPTTRRCIEVGGLSPCDTRPASECRGSGWLFVTTDAGQHWRLQLATHHAFSSISCPAPTQCYAGGYGIWARSTHGGRNWVVTHSNFGVAHIIPADSCTPEPGLSLCFIHALSCTDLSTCWGIAGRLSAGTPVRTTDGGRSWQPVARNVPTPTPYSDAGLVSLTCPRPNRCFGVGPGGLIMAYAPSR